MAPINWPLAAALRRASIWSRRPGAVCSTAPDDWGHVLLPDGQALHVRPEVWREVRAW